MGKGLNLQAATEDESSNSAQNSPGWLLSGTQIKAQEMTR